MQRWLFLVCPSGSLPLGLSQALQILGSWFPAYLNGHLAAPTLMDSASMLGCFSCLLEAFWPGSALLGDVPEGVLVWVAMQHAGKLDSVSVRMLLSDHSPSRGNLF